MRIGFLKKGTKGTQWRQARSGLTRVDVVAVLFAIFVLAILFVVVLPPRRPIHPPWIICAANLRQVEVALRVWENDAGPRMPSPEANAQTIGLNSGQIGWVNAMGISNITHLSKILICPMDRETPTTIDAVGNKIRISYFLNLDANESYPQQILSGDDNIAVSGVPVKSGIFEISSNTPISWTSTRHRHIGNIGLADGSVSQTTSTWLQTMAVYSFNGTPFVTNRFAIP